MGHSCVRIKARRKRVAGLRGISKIRTVKNNTIPKCTRNLHMVPWNTLCDKAVRFTGRKLAGKWFEISDKPDKYGLTHHLKDDSWKYERHCQVKPLRKKYRKKYYNKASITIRKVIEHPSDYDLFPKHDPFKMNRVLYMERLVEHKVDRWIRRNPQPVRQDDEQEDIFEKEFMIPWKAKLDAATEKFRNDVISTYDRLPLTARFKQNKKGTAVYQEKLVAMLKDVDGDGHKVTTLNPKTSKLLKNAQEITNRIHKKNANLVCTNLRDHKRKTGRIILPKAA